MNKAFVREPDDTGIARCPHCDGLGVGVGAQTLAAHLPAEALRELPETAFYCPYPTCDVAYFDAFGRWAGVEELRGSMFPKDSAAPLCSCFGLTTDDVDEDIAEGGAARTRALLDRAKSAEARCAELAPDGRCCVPEVQRYFMQHRAGS